MIRRGGAALLFATAVAAMAQMADTMLSSRQVATDARPVITGSNLTEVAESRRHFETNVPPGVASKAQAESAVALAFSVGFSNAVVSAVEDGGGLRFSVTGRYDFVEGATVSVDNVVLKKDAAATIGSMDADQVYAGSLSTPLLLADVLDASVSAPLGTITSPLIESSGVLNAGSVVVSNLQAGSLSADVVVPGGGPVEVYEELGRQSSYVKTTSVTNESWSIVPPPKYADAVFTDSIRVVDSTVMTPVTNTWPAYTNVVEVPVYTYTDATTTWTNPAPARIPDTGPVGVCTTSMVLRVFDPGILRTNAQGRCYIKEPAAVKPPGSGTENDPFIMERPENFRWVREEHKPGGRVRARGRYDSPSVGLSTDGGSVVARLSHRYAPYETPGEYLDTVDLTNGVMENLVVYCVQTNSIDMTDTYLWSYGQWPNGEYVEGFIGISGAPNAKFYARITNTVPADMVSRYTQPDSTLVSTGVYGDLLSSRYAMYNWANQGYAHLINYDGRGHSLLGIWVGLNPDATASARGLLGCAATAPTVRNLTIGGHIEGEWPVSTGNRSGQLDNYSASGGLFGWASLGVGSTATTTRWPTSPSAVPSDVLAQRYLVMKHAASIMSVVSNCVVFADYTMSVPGVRDVATIPHLLYPRVVFGGAFGVAGAPRGEGSAEFGVPAHLNFMVVTRPFRIYDSSFVGRREVRSSNYGMVARLHRLFGSIERAEFYGGPRTLIYAFGERPELLRTLFMDNTTLFEGDGPHRAGTASVSGRGYYDTLSIADGVENMASAPLLIAPSTGKVAVAFAQIPELATGSLSRASQLYASELGYYGSTAVSVGSERAVYRSGGPRLSVSLAGRYGSHIPHFHGSGYSDVANQYRIPENGGYRAVVGRDAVSMSTPAPTDSGVMLSIDGSGPPYYAAPYNDNYSGDSAIVVTAASLVDERYGPYSYKTREDWPPGRYDRAMSPSLLVRSAEEMRSRYVVEPENELGFGGTSTDQNYPYDMFYSEAWTRSGELDGFYPVPAGAAGVSVKETATVVETRPPGTVVDTGDVRVFSGSNDVITTSVREVDMAFTNRYAVDATYLSPTSCLLTVVNQVYQRHSKETRTDIERVSSVVSNRVASYSGAVTVDAGLYSTGDVSVEGSVQRIGANSLNPYALAGSGEALGNDLGTVRVYPGVFTNPVALAPWLDFSDGSLSFVSNAAPVHFEWWPDSAPASQTNLVVLHDGVPLSDGFNYCEPADGDLFMFDAPVPGFVVVKPGHPTDGLVAAGSLSPPDLRYLCTNGVSTSAVMQVSFASSSLGAPYMSPLPSTLWSRQDFHGVATLTNGIAGDAAYADGTNPAYNATLRVDIDNPSGAALQDDAFFTSVRVYCNYSDPAYLLPGGPHHPRATRVSSTLGYLEYDIVATQLVVFQARGDLGAMATVTLLPKEWPYEED